MTGAIVVFLDAALERAVLSPAERGLPLVWRAGPAGLPPGGAGVSEVAFTQTGLYDRPWSPAHLRHRARADGGIDLTWIPRSRLDGDRWEGPVRPADPPRYRVRVLSAGEQVRSLEVEGETATYEAGDILADFPESLIGAEAAVAQWGEAYGWGVEARTPLV